MATISINLDDKASKGLEALQAQLESSDDATMEMQDATSQLSDEQERQITIIQKQASDWKTFTTQLASATVPALSEVAVASLEVGLELEKMAHAGTEFAVKAGLKVVDTLAAMAYTGLKYTLITKGAIQVIHAVKGTTDEATAANENHERSLAGVAAKASLLGVILTTATGQWHSVGEAAAAASGVTAKHIGGLLPITAGAVAAFAAFEAIMSRTGERADELGNITTNMDRINEASSGLANDIAAPFGIIIENAKEFVSQLNPVPAIWKEIDESATRTADQMVVNINILRDLVNGTRELEEYHSRLDKQREKESAGFEAIRRVNATLATQEKDRARQAEISSIANIEAIEREITKVREKAAAEAQRGEDAAVIEQKLLAEITAIERQRTTIHSREAQHMADIDRISAQRRQAVERAESQRRQAEYDQIIATANKRFAELREIRQKEAAQEEDYYAEVDRTREVFRQSAIQAEHDRREKELASLKAAAAKAVEIEQQRQNQLKALRADAVQKAGINGQDLLNQADPRSVQRQLQQQAGQAARQQASAENQDLFRLAQKDSGGEARKQYDRILAQAQRAAELQARQQFARGQVDPEQLARAQAQVVQQQLGAAQKQGKLSADVVKALAESAQGAAIEQARTDALEQQVRVIQQQFGQMNQSGRSAAQRQRAQAGESVAMDAKLQKQVTVFAEFADVDLATLPAVQGRLSISYSHASQLTFTVIDPEHTIPIERLAFVRFWIDGATLDDGTTEQDADHPLFEGFVETVGPGDNANSVSIVCMDPTYRTARDLTVMSVPWEPGTPDEDPGSQVPPEPGTGAIPRAVYNAIQETDPDYSFAIGQSGTIGQIIAGILDSTQEPLWWRNACPGDIGTGSETPYDPTDLEPMDFVPQEKITWESESPRAATERLQRYEPRYRLMWHPGERLWRFRDITQAPEVVLRLNDPTVEFPVLSLELSPNLDRAYTALKLYGPPTAVTEEFTWIQSDVAPDGWTNTLQPIGDPITLELVGAHSVDTYRAWQIINSDKRRGARMLADWYDLRTDQYTWSNVKNPQFLLSWDGGQTWTGAANCFLDFLTGTARFPATVPYQTVDNQRSLSGNIYSGQHYFPPNAAKLVWAPFTDPLTVRYPASGFQGTAYTVAGLQLEKKEYDEQIAVGREYGIAVTSGDRLAAMAKLAQAQVEKNCDITWVGGCVLDGLDFSWCRLNRRISFAASDGSGGTLTTGWEAIKAYVTDVVYDFEEQTTTLTFSSDRAENIGDDPANIKQRLGIKTLEQRRYESVSNLWRTEVNWRGESFQSLSGVQVSSGFEYVDPDSGRTVVTH